MKSKQFDPAEQMDHLICDVHAYDRTPKVPLVEYRGVHSTFCDTLRV